MNRKGFEGLRVYMAAEKLSDEIWRIVLLWDRFAKNTIGSQLVRAADAIGANIAEGTGRGSHLDNRRFVRIARGSFHETKHWLRRSYRRQLLSAAQIRILKPIMDELGPTINAYLKSITPLPPTMPPDAKNKEQGTKNK